MLAEISNFMDLEQKYNQWITANNQNDELQIYPIGFETIKDLIMTHKNNVYIGSKKIKESIVMFN